MDHNPYRARLAADGQRTAAGKGAIERPAEAVNMVWQTRPAPPTPFENALGDALERAFDSGATTIGEVVTSLNASGLRAPDGSAWTPVSFEAQMRELGR